ncbi:MAG: outer-membrane lipoprotein carrier protein LolA [Spirochaetia bacterium]|nr:outer-membrane lipoprotein carrier protein LolA [Spirochaetia bacterium]
MTYRKLLIFLIFTSASVLYAQTQQILTATDYFEKISAVYADVNDYQADVTITKGGTEMFGTLFHKYPDKLRINFTEPEEQTIAFDGKRLVVYIPRYRVTMSQKIDSKNQVTGGASIASREGLVLLKRNYSIAYLESPDPVPLDSGADTIEMVVKLKLLWKSTQEGFRQIDLSVQPDGYIRRIVGVTPENDTIQFDFKKIIINQNIPDARFEYTPPASANIFENFLFDPGN